MTHAVRLTNREGATNSRRPLALNLPVLRLEPNAPALTLSTPGYEVIAREAIPATTDVLVENIHTYAEQRTQHLNRLCLSMPKERKPCLRRRSPTRDLAAMVAGEPARVPPNANSVSGEFHGQFQQPRALSSLAGHRHGARDRLRHSNFSPQH